MVTLRNVPRQASEVLTVCALRDIQARRGCVVTVGDRLSLSLGNDYFYTKGHNRLLGRQGLSVVLLSCNVRPLASEINAEKGQKKNTDGEALSETYMHTFSMS